MFVPKNKPLREGEIHMRHDVWQFNVPMKRWARLTDVMTLYQHYDHSVGYVLLLRAAVRLLELDGHPDGDVVRVCHYILAVLKNWKARAQAARPTEEFMRPYPDWYNQNKLPTPEGEIPMPPAPLMPGRAPFNSVGTVMRFLNRQARRYRIDPKGMSEEFVQDMLMAIGLPENELNAPRARNQLYLNQVGESFPHMCRRCGSNDHERDGECEHRSVKCNYCHANDHVVRTCRILHRFCKECFLRGHTEEDHKTSVLTLWNKWLLAAHAGVLTCRLVDRPKGHHYYENDGEAKNVEALPLGQAKQAYQRYFIGDVFDEILNARKPPGKGPSVRLRPASPRPRGSTENTPGGSGGNPPPPPPPASGAPGAAGPSGMRPGPGGSAVRPIIRDSAPFRGSPTSSQHTAHRCGEHSPAKVRLAHDEVDMVAELPWAVSAKYVPREEVQRTPKRTAGRSQTPRAEKKIRVMSMAEYKQEGATHSTPE